MLDTTLGQLLVNEVLPEDLRDYNRTLDGKSLHDLLKEVARKHPEKYRDVSFRLNQIGLKSSQAQGGLSFGIEHLRTAKAAQRVRENIRKDLEGILSDESLSDEERSQKIILATSKHASNQIDDIYREALENKNPIAMQIKSGSRGKPVNLSSLIGSDVLYADHRDEVIPIPILRSYSEGLSPEEYWAGTYGARKGILATKFATQNSGYLSKQLVQAAHRLAVVDEDEDLDPEQKPLTRGLVVDTDDMDNEGALLAKDTGPYKRNTPLTPKILNYLKRSGVDRILVRSPAVGGSPEGGVYARDVGIRERGALPGRGELVGMQAAQAISEPLSQAMLSSKHSGGIAGQEKATGGFDYINQLVQVPKQLKGGATHSTKDGTVQRVEQAPAGGHFVYVNDVKHFVPEELEIKVKKGDVVEAGDTLSDGIPNPATITQYKGVGEGRRYFVNELRKTMKATGLSPHRRNIELLARGLINHVRLTEEMGDHVPDDVVPYSTLEHTYQPRQGFQSLAPKAAVGQYLERPVLHYSIGSKIRPSMLKDLEYFGVDSVDVHKDPPPFEPAMIRGMNSLQNDPDWLVQMYGSGLKKSLINSTARGAISEERGSSFVPSLAQGKDFGRGSDRIVIKPQEPFKAPAVPEIDFDSNLLKAGFDLASDSLLAKSPTSENLKPLGSKPLTKAVSSIVKSTPTLDDPAIKNPVAQAKTPDAVPATAAGVSQVQPQQASATGALLDGAKGLVGYSLATKATDAIANKANPAMFAPKAGPPAPRTWSNLPKRFVAGAKNWIPGNNLTTAATTTPTSAPASVASKTLPAIGAYTAFNGIRELAEGGIGLGANALAETLPEGTISPETRESMRQMGWNQDQFNDSIADLQYQGNVGDAITAGRGVASAMNNPLHTSITFGQSAYEAGNRIATPMGNRLAFMADEYFGGPNSEVDNWDLGKFRDNLANRTQALASLNTPEAKARVEEYNRLLKQYDESNGWLSRLALMPAQFKAQLEKTVAAKKSRIFEIQQQLSQPNLDPTTAASLKNDLAALQTDLVDYRSFGT